MIRKALNRCRRHQRQVLDASRVLQIRLKRKAWPCCKKKFLLVGCESSGTSIAAHLLFRNAKMRFLNEGVENWVWQAYMSIYQGQSRVRDYPRLQIFDTIKVPGFAAILDKFVEEFPNTRIVYVVRDPRDIVVSAMKTWRVADREGLRTIPWVAETWLGTSSSDPVVRLAMRWKTYLEVSLRIPGVVYVRYEDFCADKVGCITSLATDLNLEVDEQWLRSQCDEQLAHSSVRNYKPQGPGGYRRGVLSKDDIRRIEMVCGEYMAKWNYDLG